VTEVLSWVSSFDRIKYESMSAPLSVLFWLVNHRANYLFQRSEMMIWWFLAAPTASFSNLSSPCTSLSLVNFTLNIADTRKYIHLKFEYTRYLQLLLSLIRASLWSVCTLRRSLTLDLFASFFLGTRRSWVASCVRSRRRFFFIYETSTLMANPKRHDRFGWNLGTRTTK